MGGIYEKYYMKVKYCGCAVLFRPYKNLYMKRIYKT